MDDGVRCMLQYMYHDDHCIMLCFVVLCTVLYLVVICTVFEDSVMHLRTVHCTYCTLTMFDLIKDMNDF